MVAVNNFFSFYDTSMVLVEQSQRPYRFGMTLLCVGALFNWLGVADSYSDPVPAIRYIGVGLIAAGAILICLAMCFWMKSVRPATVNIDSEAGMHVESLEGPDLSLEKPPDYATVVDVPPCYEDAIKLNPAALLPLQNYTFIDKCVSSKEDTARVNIADPSHDPKKTGNKPSEDAVAPNNSNNNTLSRVLRKSIRGIRKQLGSAPECSSVEAPTTSRSYNVVAVVPSKLAPVHKTTATDVHQGPMGDPPAYEETVAISNCQKDAAPILEASTSVDISSSSTSVDVSSKPCRVSEDGAAGGEVELPESPTPEIGVISNKVNDIISSAQCEAQRNSSLAYVDPSRNR
nr:PREDICTED: uncharacterized protein LOC109043025 isoform X2 [Bemisia tabaci]